MNKPNRFFCLLLLTSIPIWAETQPTFSDYPISAVAIKNVEIKDAFWLPKIKIIQDTTIQYAFKKPMLQQKPSKEEHEAIVNELMQQLETYKKTLETNQWSPPCQ